VRLPGQLIVYWSCGIARAHTASNASAHSFTAAGSSLTSPPAETPSPVKWFHRIRRTSMSQQSLPGSAMSEACRRGGQGTCSPAAMLVKVPS
jgi:hypothetical protein